MFRGLRGRGDKGGWNRCEHEKNRFYLYMIAYFCAANAQDHLHECNRCLEWEIWFLRPRQFLSKPKELMFVLC